MTELPQRLAARVNMGMGIGRQTNEIDESKNTPTMQVALPGGEVRSEIPFVQQYGFASKPEPGSDVITHFQAGDRSRGVAIASNDQRHRPKTLKAGEVCIYDKKGTTILLKEDGSIEITPGNKKVVIKGSVEIDGSVHVTGSIQADGDIKAGNISLKHHIHSKGDKGSPTGSPIS